MALATVLSRAQIGLTAPLVHVEVHVGPGLPSFTIVGLPAPVVRESKERVRAALVNSDFEFPAGRITVNLAPAELPKEGGRFDLPIALGVLHASGQIRLPQEEPCEFYGELGLDGELKPISGLLLAAVHAAQEQHCLHLPSGNAIEAQVAGCGRLSFASHLREMCAAVEARTHAGMPLAPQPLPIPPPAAPHLHEVKGQNQAKRALAIAAAGEHSLLLIGPPGCGKSMLARRLPALLPPLSHAGALEVAAIASIGGAGFDPARWGLRPFRSPHHSASCAAIVGGGIEARPGEMSLAHLGVLFLDELPEFDRRVLEALREPLETGVATIARASMRAEYPARFQLLAAMNPCPCGYRGDDRKPCRCTEVQLRRYRARISGPLLDRIDLRLELTSSDARTISSGEAAESGTAERALQERIEVARTRQMQRSGAPNARLAPAALEECAQLDSQAQHLLHRSVEQLLLSMRGRHRLIAVARTIADLEGCEGVGRRHVAEAVQLRLAPRA